MTRVSLHSLSSVLTRPYSIISFVTTLLLLPFVSKAFHIDDPFWIWTAEHIQKAPLDFYGYRANWYGVEDWIFNVTKTPPLFSYLLSLWAVPFGWNEISLHLFSLLISVVTALGIYEISKHFCEQPMVATMLSITTPLFILSGTVVMCGMSLLLFWVWSLVFWIDGVHHGQRSSFLAATVLATFCCLTKFNGIGVVLLQAFYLLLRRRGGLRPLWWIAVPILALLALQVYTRQLYGAGIVADSAAFVVDYRQAESADWLGKVVSSFAFFGGCLGGGLAVFPFLWKRRDFVWGGVALVGLMGALLWAGRLGKVVLINQEMVRWSFLSQACIWSLAGVFVLKLMSCDLLEKRDREALFISCWMTGSLFFAWMVNWSLTGRSFITLLPLLGIVCVRALDGEKVRLSKAAVTTKLFIWAPMIMMAYLVGWADFSLANASRSSVDTLAAVMQDASSKGKEIWFEGHWGFQYYMEEAGAKPLDVYASEVSAGDLLFVPTQNTNVEMPRKGDVEWVGKLETTPCRWLGVLNAFAGAGYYSDHWGPLPFVFGRVLPEEVWVFSFNRNRIGLVDSAEARHEADSTP